MTDATFPGFPGAQSFLRGLAANNDRDWFAEHKGDYERTIKGPAEAFVACVEPELSKIAGAPVGGRIFRIYRDVRFSKDKRPYNAHLHIAFGGGAGPNDEVIGGWFFGLEPDRAVVGAGGFHFQGPTLDAFRAAAADNATGAKLEAVLGKIGRDGYRIEGDQLKRVPAPYAADHARGELIRRKSLHAWKDLDAPALVASDALLPQVLAAFRALTPLVSWLRQL